MNGTDLSQGPKKHPMTGMFSNLIVIEPLCMPVNRLVISHALSCIIVEETEVGDPEISADWTQIETVRLRN